MGRRHYFTATYPASPFRNRIMASAITPNGRVNVMNRSVTHLHEGAASTAEIPDRRALRALLAEHFGIDLPEVETLRVPDIPDRAWRPSQSARAHPPVADGAKVPEELSPAHRSCSWFWIRTDWRGASLRGRAQPCPGSSGSRRTSHRTRVQETPPASGASLWLSVPSFSRADSRGSGSPAAIPVSRDPL